MNIYVAPLEGITGYIFRNAFNAYFGMGVDKYYTPFITPCEKRPVSEKEIKELASENNRGYKLVPQVMTVVSEDFHKLKAGLRDMGYEEININLGCPSKTVTSKGRGAGALADLMKLERFLEGVYKDGDKNISIKTRIGLDYTEEFIKIMELYNKYPIKELTIHPRLMKEMYKGIPHRDIFLEALSIAKMPVCYNGDINTVEDYLELCRLVKANGDKSLSGIMIGRGLLKDPALIRKIKGCDENEATAADAGQNLGAKKEEVIGMLNELQEAYAQSFSGQLPVLYKLKEIWGFLGQGIYKDNPKQLKKLMKSKSLAEYEGCMKQLLAMA